MSSTQTVLVSGSGPSGLTAALVLAQNGVSVRIIEKETSFRVGQKGVGIMPRTIEVHKFLSTFDEFWAESVEIPIVRIHDKDDGTKVVKEFHLSPPEDPTPAIPFPNLRAFGQEGQEALFRRALEKYGVQVELGIELVSFTQNADKVDVTLRHAADGKEEVASVQWLIGADGARSAVRKSLGVKFLGDEEFTQQSVVGDIYVKSGLDREHWNMFGAPPKSFVAIYPSEHTSGKEANRFSFLYTDMDVADENLPTNREELVAALKSVTNRSDIEYGNIVWMSKWKPNVRMVDTFGSGRVFLSGDAAHCHSPTGGQGMNSSIQDAVNLGWKLSLVCHGQASSKLLESYTLERLPVIAAMLNKTTTLLKATFTSADSEKTYQRGGELKMLGVNYRGSSIIGGGRAQRETQAIDPYRNSEDGKLAPGDRAPDASVGLFDIFRVTHHAILAFGSTALAQDTVAVAKGWKAPVKVALIVRAGSQEQKPDGVDYLLEDKDGSAFTNYQVSEKGVVVVVRPDGAIGAQSDSADCVKQYAGLVFA